MDFHSRIAVRYHVKTKLAELHGSPFQDFFEDLMSKRYPDFADVRTAGSIGDMSSDGLRLVARALYACYAPETFRLDRVQAKFRGDLEGALEKRHGQFDKFVFVHNDLRGLHPVITQLLAEAASEHADIRFEPFGYRKFRDEAVELSREQAEDLLGYPLPVQHVFSVQLDELIPLLEHLSRERQSETGTPEIVQPAADKLDFNTFPEETAEDLRRAFAQAPEIDRYYSKRDDVLERDEVARAFNEEYLRIRNEVSDPEDVLHQLEQYVLGNKSAPPRERRAASVVIGYFFQTCDIFENPPPGWMRATTGRGNDSPN